MNTRPSDPWGPASWVRGKSGDKSLTCVSDRSKCFRPSSPDKAEISLTGVPDRLRLLKPVRPDRAEISLTGVPDR